jgi:hypothetical protein
MSFVLIPSTMNPVTVLLSDPNPHFSKSVRSSMTYLIDTYDERLKAKAEGSTRLTYTGLCEGLEHLKTSLKDERFAGVMGECLI